MILVTGAGGFVGSSILNSRKDVIPCPSLINFTDDMIKRIIDSNQIEAILHTAAISDIGICEKHPEDSYRANVELPVALAKVAKDIKLICFSSDQVYSGSVEIGPYREDMTCPSNIYSRHKLEMEQRVLDFAPDAVMLRAEWMYDLYFRKSNYYMNILNAEKSIEISCDQYRGITYVKEVVENIDSVIKLPGGSYNFGSETDRSIYDITLDFVSLVRKDLEVIKGGTRHNLWMNCDKARSLGVTFSSVHDGLIRCAKDHGSIK